MKIALTSQSNIKLEAVKEAFKEVYKDAKVKIETPDFTPDPNQIPQPLGLRSGLAMARLRIKTLLEQYPNLKKEVDLIISIENCINEYEGFYNQIEYVDVAFIIIYDPINDYEIHEWIGCSTLPDLSLLDNLTNEENSIKDETFDYDKYCGNLLFKGLKGSKVTYGELYHKLHPDIPANNWMKYVELKLDRTVSLKIGLVKLLETIYKKNTELRQRLQECFKLVPDFPIKGVNYMMWDDIFLDSKLVYDMTKYIAHKFLHLVNNEAKTTADYDPLLKIDYVIGVESRGFLLSAPLAQYLGVGQILLRKKGKIAGQRVTKSYKKEYGEDTLELRSDLPPGNVLILDDVLATGGSLRAAAELAREAGHTVVSCIVVKDVPPLREEAAKKLEGIPYWVILP